MRTSYLGSKEHKLVISGNNYGFGGRSNPKSLKDLAMVTEAKKSELVGFDNNFIDTTELNIVFNKSGKLLIELKFNNLELVKVGADPFYTITPTIKVFRDFNISNTLKTFSTSSTQIVSTTKTYNGSWTDGAVANLHLKHAFILDTSALTDAIHALQLRVDTTNVNVHITEFEYSMIVKEVL